MEIRTMYFRKDDSGLAGPVTEEYVSTFEEGIECVKKFIDFYNLESVNFIDENDATFRVDMDIPENAGYADRNGMRNTVMVMTVVPD